MRAGYSSSSAKTSATSPPRFALQKMTFSGTRGTFKFSQEPGYTYQQWVDIPYVTYQLTEIDQPLSKTTLIQVPGEPLHVDRIKKPAK